MAARVIEAADLIVTLLADNTSPVAPNAVQRAWTPTLAESPRAVVPRGRQVYVVPNLFGQAANLDRETQETSYTFEIHYCEQWCAVGEPPLAWVDELVEYVHTIFNLLNDDVTRSSAQDGGEYLLGTLRPDTCTIAVLYDPDALREAKTFQGYIELVCTEITG